MKASFGDDIVDKLKTVGFAFDAGVEGMSLRSADPERHDVSGDQDGRRHAASGPGPRGGRALLFLHARPCARRASPSRPASTTPRCSIWRRRRGSTPGASIFRGFSRSFRPPRDLDGLSPPTRSRGRTGGVTGTPRVRLVGWSWGATVAGRYAVENATDLDRLVLVAPQWLRDTPSPLLRDPSVLERAYRRGCVPTRWWSSGPPPCHRRRARRSSRTDGSRPFSAALADPASGAHRSPNGPWVEIARNWSSGLPVWDPAHLATPVTVVVGDADDKDAPPGPCADLLAALTSGH